MEVLYAPEVGPELRRALDAKRALREKFFKTSPVISPKPVARPLRKYTAREKFKIIQSEVASEFRIGLKAIRGRDATRSVCFARQVVVFLTLEMLGQSRHRAARLIRRDRAGVQRYAKSITLLLSKDVEFDERLGRLRKEIFDKIGAKQ